MACIVMVVTVYIVMADIVVTYVGMAYMVMACTVMAYIVMIERTRHFVRVPWQRSRGLDELSILQTMPDSLRSLVLLRQYAALVEGVPVFRCAASLASLASLVSSVSSVSSV